jgi:phage baseplate assembly protein W
MDIDFPFHPDGRGRSADADYAHHVRDMIEQIVFTSPGERVNRPDFGSGLLQLVFAANSPELAATVQFTLQGALQRWLQDVIEVRALDVNSEDSTITVQVSYLLLRNREEVVATFARTI